ncbi:M50 family metallopeptidase [Paenarthrobacter sp. Z7-10]|uniref:M50 family metallopeptidase n=1 Tax=Paenarthrobacter sp. Z7-10 TaxID=2787635 RepID=UPI0022A94649|nr:M50 family metallopeptidase [Paenarthrobacter sp. Z7-10]MCZ2403219.1 M50 family metallopeptidase [Paenarthrobacter sp. Z7-10]
MQPPDQPWLAAITDALIRGTPVTPAAPVLALVAAAALLLAGPAVLWRYFGVYITVVHELGHAFAALMTGQRLRGIRIQRDQSGSTHTLARGRLPAVWSGFWGYPAPAVLGAALVAAATAGWQRATLLVGAVVVLLSIIFVRNIFGALAVLVCASVAAGLFYFATDIVQGYVLLVLGATLEVGAVRAWLNLVSVHLRRGRQLSSSDAFILQQRTRIPAGLWLLLMGAVIGACVWGAGGAALAAASG